MTGFEPWTSGIGSDHSTNWATTTAQLYMFFYFIFVSVFKLIVACFIYFYKCFAVLLDFEFKI